MEHFHKIRYIALGLGIVSLIIAWYVLVLMTNPPDDYSIDQSQVVGLAFSVGIALFVWLRNCFTIRPHT